MAFTYLNELSTNTDKMRLLIGDTSEDSGVRPDGRNFSDEELAYFLSTKGRLTWAVALAFETLANEWSSAAISEKQGDHSIDAKEVAKQYSERASEWYQKTDITEQGGAIGLQVWSEYDSTTTHYDSDHA